MKPQYHNRRRYALILHRVLYEHRQVKIVAAEHGLSAKAIYHILARYGDEFMELQEDYVRKGKPRTDFV